MKIGSTYDIYLIEDRLEKGMRYNGVIDDMHEFTKRKNSKKLRVIRAERLDEREKGIILEGNWGIIMREEENI